jgi:hypothetical protein
MKIRKKLGELGAIMQLRRDPSFRGWEHQWQGACCGHVRSHTVYQWPWPNKVLLNCKSCGELAAHYRIGSALWQAWTTTTRSYLYDASNQS